MKTVENLLCDLQDELHYEQYPSDKKNKIYKEVSLEGDYFPLHMVKTTCNRFLEEGLNQLYLECEHGDEEHRQWLKDKFNQFLENSK